jgi:serine/threonine-protein kinase RsbT
MRWSSLLPRPDDLPSKSAQRACSSNGLTKLHPTYQKLFTALERYISGMNARALLHQAVKDAGGSLAHARTDELTQVGASLTRSLPIFVKQEARERAIADVRELCGMPSNPDRSARVEIRIEADVSRARSEARRLCEAFGTSAYTVQRVTTIVSELARNIVSYTPGGSIELSVRTEGGQRMLVSSRDSGKGIPNLDEILSGKYRSRTGLGKGIIGSRRLADVFNIDTTAQGTRIDLEVRF